MQIYRVGYDDFFRFANNHEMKQYFDTNHARCHEPMSQLIRRYNLQNKSVLSVGSASGYQEYCFYENGCSLTLCDIDEHHEIEPYLNTLKSRDDGLTFALGDARYLDSSKKFDIVFFSGFTPNELRNIYSTDIRRKMHNRYPFIRRFIDKPIWYKKPLMELVIEIVDNTLSPNGGLFIFQSYTSDTNASHPEFVAAVKNQLKSLGVMLLDVYYYENHPHVHLLVGIRSTNVPRFEHEITAFHGRGIQAGSVKKSFSYNNHQ